MNEEKEFNKEVLNLLDEMALSVLRNKKGEIDVYIFMNALRETARVEDTKDGPTFDMKRLYEFLERLTLLLITGRMPELRIAITNWASDDTLQLPPPIMNLILMIEHVCKTSEEILKDAKMVERLREIKEKYRVDLN